MGLYRRRRVWFIDWVYQGIRYHQSTGCSSKREARIALAQLQARVASGTTEEYIRPEVPTLKEFKDQFIEYIEAQCKSHPRTIEFYRQSYEKLLSESASLARARLDKIDEAMIDRYVVTAQKSLMVATVNRRLSVLRRALRLAHVWKLIDRVPTIKLLKGERQREFIFTPAIYDQYLEAAPEPLCSVFQFLTESGMRVGEALQLRRTDITLYDQPDDGVWGFIKNERGKSKHARRTVIITTTMRDVILDWKARFPNAVTLFTAPDGQKPLSRHTINAQARKVRDKLELPWDCVLHSCRHTFGSKLGMAGADVFTIQLALGHASVTMSQRYVHPTSDSLKRAVRGMLDLDKACRSTKAKQKK